MTEIRGGLFIAFEGGDGAGKTTQLDLLEQWMHARDLDCERTREPGGTEIGERLRTLVLEHGQGQVDPRTEALIFAASRSAHVVQRIQPAIEAGTVILCDRYVDSSVAYQGAGRGLGTEQIAALNAWATDELMPDLTVLLDLDPEVAEGRRSQREGGSADRMESADADFRRVLRRAFLDQASADPQRYLVVDAHQDAHAVHAHIARRIEQLLEGRES